MSNETVTYSLETVLTRIEGKIDSLQRDVNERLTKLEIGQSEIRGDIKALDSKVMEIEKRIDDLNARVNITTNGFLGIVGILVTGILGILGKIVFFPNL
jgi:predicted nuclease with TOPRIM domain